MKKVLLTVAMFIALSASVCAQSPNEFNYQAVARDASGNVIANQAVGVQISIISTDPTTGTLVYTEEHTVTTNDFGLMNFTIGSGTVTAGDFTTIDWGNDAHFLEVSMDLTGGTTYTVMGTQQLVSVPYALHAETAGSVANDLVDDADADPANEIQVLSISNDTLYLSNGGFVDLASYAVDNVDDADADPTNELQDWTTLPGIPVDFSDNADNVDDADNDPTNEIETWSTLAGIPAGFLDGIDNVDDADADPTNELQDWTTLPGIPAGFSDNIDNVDDADNDPTNEIQDLSLTGNTLSLTSDASTVDLSSYLDNTDNQTLSYDATANTISISGGNTIALPNTIAFSAWRTGSATVNPGYSLDCPNEVYDNGNNYAGGIFTAPEAGVYNFTYYHCYGANVGATIIILLDVNGTQRQGLHTRVPYSSAYQSLNANFSVVLNAGDQVRLRYNGNATTAYGNADPSVEISSRFSGYKVR